MYETEKDSRIVPKRPWKSMKMGSKIDRKSMKSRGCVADAILMRSGGHNAQKSNFFGIPFWNHFRPKIPKNVKKKWIRSSGTVPERPKTAKKTIFERLGKRLVFWMVSSLKKAYFWRPFSMKKPSKNPCWFWTWKSYDFWWKNNGKTAWVFAYIFYFFASFSKSA